MILRVRPDAAAAARAAAALLVDVVTGLEGPVHVALSAGRGVAAMLAALPAESASRGTDAARGWSRVTWIVADERDVPVGDARRNDAAIARGLDAIDATIARDGRMVRMAPETGATRAVRALTDRLASISTLDLAMLGLGDDGHVASLFPGHPALAADGVAVHLADAPADPPGRMTLTLGVLGGASRRVVVTAGAGKRDAIGALARGADLPVTRWRPTDVILDEAALPDGIDPRLVRRGG